MQRYGDLFQIEVMFSTEYLEFLKIIHLAEISKQSCSKLKYAVCIYTYTFQICVRSFAYLKKMQGRMHQTFKKKNQTICVGFIEF